MKYYFYKSNIGKFSYFSNKKECHYDNFKRKAKQQKRIKNNNTTYLYEFKLNNIKSIIKQGKIDYAIKFNIFNLDLLEKYHYIAYDYDNKSYIIDSESKSMSFMKSKNKEKIKNINGEIWKEINEIQLVSNYGRIKNIFDREIKPRDKGNGYLVFTESITGKTLNLARTVLSTFEPNYDNKLEVNHKDFNKKNNKLSNLEWCTRKENIHHKNYKKKGSCHDFTEKEYRNEMERRKKERLNNN